MYNEKLKLCYVDDNVAYFTTQELSEQWGDDWDDAPYEHNAGRPYEPSYYHYSDERGSVKNPKDWNEDGTPKWEIEKIMFDADVMLPNYGVANSDYSVQDINKKKIAWIRSFYYTDIPPIYAGTNVLDFIEAIEKMGGECYGKISIYNFQFTELC